MAERPTSQELLDVIAGFLRSLQAEAEGETRYNLLVAAHACEIVARDVGLRPAHAQQDLVLLRELSGSASPADVGQPAPGLESEIEALTHALAQRIRDGGFDDRLEWLALQLLPMTRRKLAIARPGYDS